MVSTSEKQTIKLGEQIGRKLKQGDVVALYGEFGAGKTVLIKGIAEGIGCKEIIKSPSFVYVHEYKGRLPVFHIDLYRVNNTQDIMTLGIHEFINSEGICLIEWAEKGQGMLPKNAIAIHIKIIDEKTREIECRY